MYVVITAYTVEEAKSIENLPHIYLTRRCIFHSTSRTRNILHSHLLRIYPHLLHRCIRFRIVLCLLSVLSVIRCETNRFFERPYCDWKLAMRICHGTACQQRQCKNRWILGELSQGAEIRSFFETVTRKIAFNFGRCRLFRTSKATLSKNLLYHVVHEIHLNQKQDTWP